MSVGSVPALLEREVELEAVAGAMAHASQGSGQFVVIDGAAGVGKTALLAAAFAAAGDEGLLTLRARGAELERDFVFGVVRQLFDDLLLAGDVDPASLFTGAARFAAPLLEAEVDGAPATAPDDPFAARHALYWLTANLAAQHPVAMLVDDCHWADSASLGALAHIAHRLEGIGVALVLVSRSEELSVPLDAVRREAEQSGTLLHLSPLGEEAAAAVVRSFVPGADDALCRACHLATGGNPFMLRELARSLIAGESVVMDSTGVTTVSPVRVTREVAARLARLPEAAAYIANAAAVLGGYAPLRQAAALAGLDEEEAAAAAEALMTAGVLRSSQPLEFLHPLVQAAVYAGIGDATLATKHARAARVLEAEGASPERVAAQLLRSVPANDSWVYERLVAAARLASARGAPEAAVTYLRRALAEPPPQDALAEILLQLAVAEGRASDPIAAIEHLRAVLSTGIAIEQRHRAAMFLAGLLGHTGRVAEGVDLLEEQIQALAERPDLQANAEAALSNIARLDPLMRRRTAPVVERLRARVKTGGETDHAVLGTICAEMAMAGEPAEPTAELAAEVVASFDASGIPAQDWSGWNAIRTLVLCGRYDAPLAILNRAQETARERGAVLEMGSVFVFRAELYLQIGDIVGAELDARALREIADDYGWTIGGDFGLAWLGDALMQRGELEEAEQLLTAGMFAGPPAAVPPAYMRADVLLARGRLRVAQGRPGDALEDMRECGRRQTELGNLSPILCAWRSHLAHALMDLGETDEATELASEELAIARRVGVPRALAVALRAMARARGGREELALLREAAEVVEPSGAQLERARVQAALGSAMYRAGQAEEAREALRLAVDLAHRCGARAIESRALAELRATGARPRRRLATGAGSLTPSERRIAELAASGQLNREIAETLFVTTNTVEYHLRNAYRKLGISGRTQLAEALSTDALA